MTSKGHEVSVSIYHSKGTLYDMGAAKDLKSGQTCMHACSGVCDDATRWCARDDPTWCSHHRLMNLHATSQMLISLYFTGTSSNALCSWPCIDTSRLMEHTLA
jgi:hypothetical protein